MLRDFYHCDIIVDDVSYSGECGFQDGEIAEAVNDVTAKWVEHPQTAQRLTTATARACMLSA